MLRSAIRGRRTLALAIALSLATLLAFACNGDGSPDQDTGTPQPASTQTPEGTASPGSTPTASGTEGPVPTIPPDATPLERLAATYLIGVEGKVSYRYISAFGEHPDGIWTVYRRAGDFREDWNTNVDGLDATTAVFLTGTDVFICTQGGDFISCFRDTEENALGLMPWFIPITEVPQAILEGVQELVSTELAGETIAGVEARCFQIDVPGRIGVGPEGREEIKICFRDDGLLLLLERSVIFDNPSFPQVDLSLEAMEVGIATDGDFEPLAPVE